ncbi:DUF2934 domain-containing protein [Salmonella enterica]|nr:DUF2934 domain-containing protein [Salmonella enterica]
MDNRDEAAIRARAYQLWVESGYADGYQDQHWRQAEREVAERAADGRAADGRASDGRSEPEARADDRGQPRDARHSDGMSSHPSVLDPGPIRARG